LKAAEDQNLLKTVLTGRTVDELGRPISIDNPVTQTVQQGKHLALFKNPTAPMTGAAFSYENLASVTPVKPLYPARKEGDRELIPIQPEVAISYASVKDPLSNKFEQWVRVSTR